MSANMSHNTNIDINIKAIKLLTQVLCDNCVIECDESETDEITVYAEHMR